MDVVGFEAKEKHLSGLLSQEIVDLLSVMRFKCINKDSECLGFELPLFVEDYPVIAFVAVTEQRIEFSAQWESRPLRTHYLLRAGFVNLPLLQEGLKVLEAAWKTVLEMPADEEMADRDWDQEIKEALKGIRLLRQDRVKMLKEMEEKPQAIHGTPKPHVVEGAVGCGLDIKVVTKDEQAVAEQVELMQRIEEEQI